MSAVCGPLITFTFIRVIVPYQHFECVRHLDVSDAGLCFFLFFFRSVGVTPLDIFKDNFQPWLLRPKQVFLAKTWAFPNPHQMVRLLKPSQTISTSSSSKIVATDVCFLMSGALMGTHQAAVCKSCNVFHDASACSFFFKSPPDLNNKIDKCHCLPKWALFDMASLWANWYC